MVSGAWLCSTCLRDCTGTMPIYKIARRGEQERRATRSYRRLRLTALLVAGVLLLATVGLLLDHLHRLHL